MLDTIARRPSFWRILLYCMLAALIMLVLVAAIGPLFTYGETWQ